MKVVHLVESFTVHVARIAEHQTHSGEAVKVIAFHSHGMRGPHEIIRVHPKIQRLPFSHHWAGISQFQRLVREFDPDVVHGHYLSTAALYLAASWGRPTIASAIGSDILLDPCAAHARILVRFCPIWVERFTSAAPHITQRMVALGIPARRVSTFPWGIDRAIFHPSPSGTDFQSVISTRSLEPLYDVETLIRAFPSVISDLPTARLTICGDGTLRRSLQELASQVGVGDYTQFQGQREPGEIAEALRRAGVYVSTSRSDGASTSLLEAMATGLVPVVTDIEANRAWIADGKNGLLFTPGDFPGLGRQIVRAIRDVELRSSSFHKNPLIVAHRADWRASMDRLRKVYRSAMDGSR